MKICAIILLNLNFSLVIRLLNYNIYNELNFPLVIRLLNFNIYNELLRRIT